MAGFCLTESEYDRGTEIPAHRHSNAYLSFPLEGGYRELIGMESRLRVAGAVAFHPADEWHSDSFSDGRGRVLSVELSSAWLAALPVQRDRFARSSEMVGGAASALMHRVHVEFCHWDPGAEIAVQGLLLIVQRRV